jgi:predicted acetyltransferase
MPERTEPAIRVQNSFLAAVLITCDQGNIASRKVTGAHGGIFGDTRGSGPLLGAHVAVRPGNKPPA